SAVGPERMEDQAGADEESHFLGGLQWRRSQGARGAAGRVPHQTGQLVEPLVVSVCKAPGEEGERGPYFGERGIDSVRTGLTEEELGQNGGRGIGEGARAADTDTVPGRKGRWGNRVPVVLHHGGDSEVAGPQRRSGQRGTAPDERNGEYRAPGASGLPDVEGRVRVEVTAADANLVPFDCDPDVGADGIEPDDGSRVGAVGVGEEKDYQSRLRLACGTRETVCGQGEHAAPRARDKSFLRSDRTGVVMDFRHDGDVLGHPSDGE